MRRYIIVVFLFANPGLLLATGELESELLTCSALQDSKQRLFCYDNLGRELFAKKQRENVLEAGAGSPVLEVEKGAVEGSAVKSKPEKAASLPEGLGGKQFEVDSQKHRRTSKVLAKGRVVSCKKAVDEKWFFVFENDQIWKQVGSSRRNFRRCDFIASIKKDGIGFKMQIEGESKTIRVKRYR